MSARVWHERRTAAVPRGIGHVTNIYADRAQNAEVWDIEGRRYIDFSAGIAVVNTGHNHPKVRAAVERQLARFTHTCFHVVQYTGYVELAEKLNALTPGRGPKKTMFATTGAEAIENAIKIARAYTRRSGVIAFAGGFHGRTMMSLALTGKVTPYKAGFGPFPGEVHHALFADPRRGVTTKDSLASLDRIFKEDIEPARVAAMIVEHVQGEGGFNIAPPDFLQALRALCDTHGIILIVDEIQTGFARTGRLFATEYSAITPDIVTMAKGLGGGYPLSAITGKAEIMDAAATGGLGGTFAGSPVGIAAALAVLDVIEEEKLAARALAIGETIAARLKSFAAAATANQIGDVRHLGAMVAMELVKHGDRDQPDADLVKALIALAASKGLILLSCGTHGNVLRILTPLTIPDANLAEGLDILEHCLAELGVLRARGG